MRRELEGFWGWVSVLNGIALISIAMVYIFNLHVLGFVLPANSYLYVLLGLALFQTYLVYPGTSRFSRQTFPLDILLALASLAIALFLAINGRRITAEGWMLMPPDDAVIWICAAFVLLVLECLRRVAGLALFILCSAFVLFPLVAGDMPSLLLGNSFSPSELFTMHVLDSQSLVGIPMTVTGTLLIGYIVFGVVLNKTGGGKFFLDGASALTGHYRGGAGKVSVVASALFGSMSGSSISNVITTGAVTIPAMKRSGFKPHEAGAIEACASTGGMIMPPVMGAVAFLMAQFLNVSYFTVVLAALVPSLLYFTGLLLVLDARAARAGLAGLPREDLPTGRKVLVNGWPYIATLLLLIYLLYLRLESQAPFWAIALLLAAVLLTRRDLLRIGDFGGLLKDISISVSELVTTIGAVGFIIGAMSMTGVGTAFSSELVSLAGNNSYLLLLLGAFASFVLGMGLSASACYIFLAVVLAPGLVTQGFDEIAVHLFIIYWAIISNITPPVALACFPAARLAQTSYFRVGFHAVAFGFVSYIVPFAFVLNPALVLKGTPVEIAMSLAFAFVGIALAAFGVGRRAPVAGELPIPVAAIFVVTGIAICMAPALAVKFAAFLLLGAVVAGQKALQKRQVAAAE